MTTDRPMIKMKIDLQEKNSKNNFLVTSVPNNLPILLFNKPNCRSKNIQLKELHRVLNRDQIYFDTQSYIFIFHPTFCSVCSDGLVSSSSFLDATSKVTFGLAS